MSFTVTLQNTYSEKNKIGKSFTTIASVSGTLREGTSILNPVILLEASVSSIKNCNYMTIDEFGRKYFITDIRSTVNGLVEISGHVDVLETYKTNILALDVIAGKQEKRWNLYIDDGTFKVYNNQLIVTKEFSSGFNNHEYVLAIAGS